jgi:hypothetical protein
MLLAIIDLKCMYVLYVCEKRKIIELARNYFKNNYEKKILQSIWENVENDQGDQMRFVRKSVLHKCSSTRVLSKLLQIFYGEKIAQKVGLQIQLTKQPNVKQSLNC